MEEKFSLPSSEIPMYKGVFRVFMEVEEKK
jgi:hypothetical protein